MVTQIVPAAIEQSYFRQSVATNVNKIAAIIESDRGRRTALGRSLPTTFLLGQRTYKSGRQLQNRAGLTRHGRTPVLSYPRGKQSNLPNRAGSVSIGLLKQGCSIWMGLRKYPRTRSG
jgi:hypothetical protein